MHVDVRAAARQIWFSCSSQPRFDGRARARAIEMRMRGRMRRLHTYVLQRVRLQRRRESFDEYIDSEVELVPVDEQAVRNELLD